MVYPNNYIKLMGPAGTGKGVAMGIGRDLLKGTGYKKFAATKASKEMFIANIVNIHKQCVEDAVENAKSILDLEVSPYSDVYVLASEFNSFVPPGDIDFLMMLTDLWDNLDVYDNPKITSKSVKVDRPTVNLLAANTPHMFNTAFPSESVGSGTLSRFLLINGKRTGKKILFGKTPDPKLRLELIEILCAIRDNVKGEATFDDSGLATIQAIYNSYKGLNDTRFEAYNERRIAHLMKLSLIFSAADLTTVISADHVINANTQLCAAECGMPLALGHFGRSKTSALTHKILEFIGAGDIGGVSNDDVIKALHREVSNKSEILSIMQLLAETAQIKAVTAPQGGHRWCVVPTTFPDWAKPFINASLLTEQEQDECNLMMPTLPKQKTSTIASSL